jgi:choline/glycine/proline betaine transport protein
MAAIDKVKQHIHPVVFPVSAAVIIGFVIFGTVFSSTDADGNTVGLAPDTLVAVRGWITANLGWFFIAAVATFIIFLLFLVVSRYGKIRLGPDDSRPDYSYLTWFAMLFSAGMGIGLVFWGVAEPIAHFVDAPRPDWVVPRATAASRRCCSPSTTGASVPGRSTPCSASRWPTSGSGTTCR